MQPFDVPPPNSDPPPVVVVARYSAATFFAAAAIARWLGIIWAEPLAVGAGLTAVFLLASLGGDHRFSRTDLWSAGFFSLWLALFTGSLLAGATPVEKTRSLPASELRSRIALHAYGPLSVVVDRNWWRLVQPPEERHVLVVTDGIALTFSAEAYQFAEGAAGVSDEADALAEAIVAEEGFRLLETWDGTVRDSKAAERLMAKDDGKTYCLLVVTDRDGFRIMARGDAFDEFGDRDVVGELRRIAASLRAIGDASNETSDEAGAPGQEEPT